MPFVIWFAVSRIQRTTVGRPDLNRGRIDETVFNRVILPNQPDPVAPVDSIGICGVGALRLAPVFQAKGVQSLQELVFGIHPFLSPTVCGRARKSSRVVIRGKPSKSGRPGTRIAGSISRTPAGARGCLITQIIGSISSLTATVMGYGRSGRFLTAIVDSGDGERELG